MTSTLRALLTGIIDYAGLFPPAQLPLDQALRHYADYRQSPDQWMLGRFIIPAARLPELSAFANVFRDRQPFVFSVLGRGGKTAEEFLQGIAADLQAIAAFRKQHAGSVEVDGLEVNLPDAIVHSADAQLMRSTLLRTAEAIEEAGPPALTPYYEISLGTDWRSHVQSTHVALRYLASYQKTRPQGPYLRYRTAGFKLRCGGLEAAAFPSPEQVAAVIVSCRDHGIAFKATAGLHHPLRRFDASVQAAMHGFLNVFGAAALAAAYDLAEDDVREIVEDEDAGHVAIDETGLRWDNLRITTNDVAAARQQLAIAFGSCSFDEPREDLRTLKFLP